MAEARRRKTDKMVSPPTVSKPNFYCCRCGAAYGRQKGNFPVSHSPLYRGSGYLPMCNNCVDELYEQYCASLPNEREAVRRMCMKLDLYWNDSIFDMAQKTVTGNSLVRNYIGKTNIYRFIDKNFDDTLKEEKLAEEKAAEEKCAACKQGYIQDDQPDEEEVPEKSIEDIPESVRAFWGPGYTPEMYEELEDRFRYWMSRYPDDAGLDAGTEALLRQICCLEIDINHERAAGKSADKLSDTLSKLLAGAKLRPDQKKTNADAMLEKTPFGVWIKRWEDKKPIPEPDPEMKDRDGIIRYIEIWMKGHLAKMLGYKNAYSKIYEDEIAKMRVERPEFDDEDDESFFEDVFSEAGNDDKD